MTLARENTAIDDLVSATAARTLRAFRREAEEVFPDRVADVILFGSRARGEGKRSSDYDVAVLIHGLSDPRSAHLALAHIAHGPKYARQWINAIALPSDYVERPNQTALAMAIAREGVAIR